LRFSLAFDLMLACKAGLDHPLHQAVRRFTHDRGARLGERLQTGSKVDRITVK
jgi:hypothetical protein